MKIWIELLSDLCVSTGESYNSYIDTDVVYDDYGMPYIPGKRIKGCIREAALELVEFGVASKEAYDRLFGDENSSTLFSLDNAYLIDYDKYIYDLKNCKDKELVYPSRVLGMYTYSRTQTAVGTNGAADEGSLRTIRVINKGLKFQATLNENVALSEEEKDLLTKSVGMVKHMGNSRTRGLGLVEMRLEEGMAEAQAGAVNTATLGAKNKISYSITLKSPVLCKAPTGSQEKSQDYFEGSKMLGVLAQNLNKDDFANLMNHNGAEDGIIVSNAYICDGKERCTPLRISYQKKKDQTFNEEGLLEVADMLLPNEEDIQWSPVGNGYMSPDGTIKGVDVETNYHHRRPEDKSIGRATSNAEDSAFYQLESIRKDQTFAGFILADEKQAAIVLDTLSKGKDARMGYGRNAEYGKVEITVTKVEDITTVAPRMTNSFVMKLNSAVILYNANGMPSGEVTTLKEYVAEVLGLQEDEIRIANAFLSYETIGGFNVTWGRRKPIFTALGKGTVVHFETGKEVDIASLNNTFIGERVAEGYGEVEASTQLKSYVTLKKTAKEAKEEVTKQSDILDRLSAVRCREEIVAAGAAGANAFLDLNPGIIKKAEFKPSLNKLIQIVKNEEILSKIQAQVDGIETDSKKEICNKMLRKANADLAGASYVISQEEAEKIYLYNFLNQIKYKTYKKGGDANE